MIPKRIICIRNGSLCFPILCARLGSCSKVLSPFRNPLECSASRLSEASKHPFVAQTKNTTKLFRYFVPSIPLYQAMTLFLPKCFTCRQRFDTTSARDQHCREALHDWPWNECHKCFSWFRQFWELQRHWKRLNHYDHECTYCDKTFPTVKKQHDHELKRHFYCGDCNRTFQNPNNLQMVSLPSFGQIIEAPWWEKPQLTLCCGAASQFFRA